MTAMTAMTAITAITAAADVGGWTSVDVATLIVAGLTPVTVTVLGVLLARGARRVAALQQANERVVERRVEVFDLVAAQLNRLLCFATFVGRWKEISADKALEFKRDLDEVMYANRPLFGAELFEAYRAFMACLFAMYATVDGDALIRCQIRSQWGDRSNLPWWDPAMAARFTDTQDATRTTTPQQAEAAYHRLSAAFRDDLYVTALTRPLPPPAGS
jgi:hypothetical protein